jgi:hypothetical protein
MIIDAQITDEIEEKALVIQDKRIAAPDIIKQAEILAEKTWRFMGITKESAVSVYLKGWELGFKMTAAPEFIYPIQGKPALSPRGHLALIHNSGIFQGDGCFRVKDLRDDKGKPVGCTVYMKRGDSNVEYEITFTLDEAKAAGLIKSDSGWEKYPSNMCRWRAIGYCADVVAPDIGGGMKRADEYGADITPDGDVIIGSWIENKKQPQTTLNDLVNRFAPDDILNANNGRMPSTQAEINAVMAKLSEENNG